MVAAILFPVNQVMYDWLKHTTWFHSNRALPRSMEFDFIFLHNTDANMLCRLFDDHKYMDIYLPILQEYRYKEYLVNCAKCEQIPSKYVIDGQFEKFFKVY